MEIPGPHPPTSDGNGEGAPAQRPPPDPPTHPSGITGPLSQGDSRDLPAEERLPPSTEDRHPVTIPELLHHAYGPAISGPAHRRALLIPQLLERNRMRLAESTQTEHVLRDTLRYHLQAQSRISRTIRALELELQEFQRLGQAYSVAATPQGATSSATTSGCSPSAPAIHTRDALPRLRLTVPMQWHIARSLTLHARTGAEVPISLHIHNSSPLRQAQLAQLPTPALQHLVALAWQELDHRRVDREATETVALQAQDKGHNIEDWDFSPYRTAPQAGPRPFNAYYQLHQGERAVLSALMESNPPHTFTLVIGEGSDPGPPEDIPALPHAPPVAGTHQLSARGLTELAQTIIQEIMLRPQA